MTAGRIGVLTFHRCFNYGSYWQARCLVEGLRARGHDAELIDHDCDRVNRAEARCLLQPTLPIRTGRSDFAAYKAKGRAFIAAAGGLPMSARVPLAWPEGIGRYDAVVVGSDEVWNFQHPWYGGKRLFFGGGLEADRMVSYAASFGNHDAAYGMDPCWAGMLRGFSAVSVRDANSSALIRGAIGTDPAMVLDPCLQFPEVIDVAAEPGGARYGLIYGHGFPDWLVAAVIRWRRRTGVRLVSVGYRNDWADEQRIDAGPIDYARLMAGAAMVVTNFFHGSVFAILNRKPFAAAPSAYRFNKLRDLTALLGLTDHIVTAETGDDRYDALLAGLPREDVANRIAALRHQSNAFLDRALA